MDTAKLRGLQKRAQLILEGLSFTNPRILKDGIVCSSPACVIESYSGGTLVFTVSGFSVYNAEEIPVSPPSDGGTSGGGSSGGGTNIEDLRTKEKEDNRSVEVSIINGTTEEPENIELDEEAEDTQLITVTNGTTLFLKIEGSDKEHIVSFELGDDKVTLMSEGRSYELSRNELVPLSLEGKDIYFGIRDFGLGNALVVFGFDEENVRSEIGKNIDKKQIIYILIGIATILTFAIVLLIRKYLRS